MIVCVYKTNIGGERKPGIDISSISCPGSVYAPYVETRTSAESKTLFGVFTLFITGNNRVVLGRTGIVESRILLSELERSAREWHKVSMNFN